MNALDRLMARKGQTQADFSRRSRLGQSFRNKGVANTPELQRILEVPAYRWQDDPEIQEVQDFIDATYGKPFREECHRQCGHEEKQRPGECPECDRAALLCVCKGDGIMHTRPLQAAALMAIHDYRGMLGPLRVGAGKTLISFLAAPVADAERALLLIPAKLKNKTKREFARLSRHWVAPQRMHLMSYELLARDRGVAELEAYHPQIMVADEGQKLKSLTAACTKRVRRHLQETNKDCIYVDMSGTIVKRSVMEFYHRQNWALMDGLQPLPRGYNEARDWADAIDEKVTLGRLMPGALYQFCTPEELADSASNQDKSNQVKVARQAFQRRLMSTPGVVGTEDQFDGAMSLIITESKFTPGDAVVEAFAGLRENWELPDGHPIDDPPTLWRAARCLIQGFFYKWSPQPPKEWMMWRKEWSRCVREILKTSCGLDTQLQATREVERGLHAWARPIYDDWMNVRPTFKPNTVAFWVDDAAYLHCLKWAKQNVGIIWVNEVALGVRLHKEGGLPYYGAQGMCDGKMIEDETGACVASIMANCEGRNLQHFSKNLIAAPPPGGATWEQMFGRTHRDGQEADEVIGEVIVGCYENWKIIMQAIRDAEFAERTIGQAQKLNFADVDLPGTAEIVELANTDNPLWSKENADFFQDSDTWSENEVAFAGLTPTERAERRKEHYAGG